MLSPGKGIGWILSSGARNGDGRTVMSPNLVRPGTRVSDRGAAPSPARSPTRSRGTRSAPARDASVSRFQMPVDGGAGDPEFGGDLRHGVRAFALVVGLVVHLLGQGDLAGAEFGFLAAGAAAGAGGGESVDGALGHEGVLELGDGTEDLKEHAAEGGGVLMPWSRTTRSTPRS